MADDLESRLDKAVRPRRSAVEAAQARLEAAKKRERVGLLKKALVKVEEAVSLIQASGDVHFVLDGEDKLVAAMVLVDIREAIRAELGE